MRTKLDYIFNHTLIQTNVTLQSFPRCFGIILAIQQCITMCHYAWVTFHYLNYAWVAIHYPLYAWVTTHYLAMFRTKCGRAPGRGIIRYCADHVRFSNIERWGQAKVLYLRAENTPHHYTSAYILSRAVYKESA